MTTPSEIQNSDWYQGLCDEISSTVIETAYRTKMEVLECWHGIGTKVAKVKREHGEGVVSKLAKDCKIGVSTLYDAIRLAEEAPNLEKFLEDKDKTYSWHKFVHRERIDEEKVPCPKCGTRVSKSRLT